MTRDRATLDNFALGVECIKLLTYCRLNAAVGRNNKPFPLVPDEPGGTSR